MARLCSSQKFSPDSLCGQRGPRQRGGPRVPTRAFPRIYGARPPPVHDDPRHDAVGNLMSALEGAGRGLTTSGDGRAAIMAAVETLEGLGAESVTTGEDLSSRWRLLWTTEKETLFILRNARWFGTEAGDVYQIIDVGEGRLQNVITFPPTGSFVVDSSIEVVDDKRVAFEFKTACLKVPGMQLPVPPYGKGWFDTVYVDDDIRVAKDSRNDTLIVARDGPPEMFET